MTTYVPKEQLRNSFVANFLNARIFSLNFSNLYDTNRHESDTTAGVTANLLRYGAPTVTTSRCVYIMHAIRALSDLLFL